MLEGTTVAGPTQRLGSALTVMGAAVCGLAVVTSVVVGHHGKPLPIDVVVSDAARQAAALHPVWVALMRTITLTGGIAVLGLTTCGLCVLLLWRRRRRAALFAAAAMAVTLLVRWLMVAVIARPRPVDRLANASNWSYPSGHSAASAAFAAIVVLVCVPLLRRTSLRVVLILAAVAWAGVVGVSRVALVVHWPSDVVGAWLLALVIVPATYVVVPRQWNAVRAAGS
jgi:undecaprenyl-diphosphatase